MQALFETPPKDYNTWCPYFLDRYTNPTVDDILRSVTPPGMEVSKGEQEPILERLAPLTAHCQAVWHCVCVIRQRQLQVRVCRLGC